MSRYRLPAVLRLGSVLAVLLVVVATGFTALGDRAPVLPPAPSDRPADWAHFSDHPGAPAPEGDPGLRTLVLFDDSGAVPEVGRGTGVMTANLVSGRTAYELRPVRGYRRGDAAAFTALVVLVPDATRLPPELLAEVGRPATPPVIWLGEGMEQVFERRPDLRERLGWEVDGRVGPPPASVLYKGRSLGRDSRAGGDLPRIVTRPGGRAQVLAEAVGADGVSVPYAVRSGTVTYVSEVPFGYVGVVDRYAAVADLVSETVRPGLPERRRALVRLEDVGPSADPEQLRAVADYLWSRGVPFSVAVYPRYLDPAGAENSGRPTAWWLADRPRVVEALRYMTGRGGTLIMHGVTHQADGGANPYNGTSGADFEFYATHIDERDDVRLDGPFPGDSRSWAADRIRTGRGEFDRVGLPAPTMFEFPHYAGSAAAYEAVDEIFGVRYDNGTYFTVPCTPGACTDGAPGMVQQYFPYVVRDAYGSVVVPENLGNVTVAEYNNHPVRSPESIVDAADRLLVVRDGVASFFYHPFLGVDRLRTVVEGIEGLGYRFVAPAELVGATGPPPAEGGR